MSQAIPKGHCDRCRSSWAWGVRQWVVKDPRGRMSFFTPPLSDGEPVALQVCPNCQSRSLRKATVAEVVDE